MTGACVRDYTVLAAAGLLTNARKSYNCVNVSVSSATVLFFCNQNIALGYYQVF